MEPDDLLCSRNARPEKALVERAQWKINQPPSLMALCSEHLTVCYSEKIGQSALMRIGLNIARRVSC